MKTFIGDFQVLLGHEAKLFACTPMNGIIMQATGICIFFESVFLRLNSESRAINHFLSTIFQNQRLPLYYLDQSKTATPVISHQHDSLYHPLFRKSCNSKCRRATMSCNNSICLNPLQFFKTTLFCSSCYTFTNFIR